MGAIFLFHKQSGVNEPAVRELYVKKGFSDPACFVVDDYHIWLYRKQHVDSVNFISSEDCSLYVCGSLFYKGLNYSDSLRELLSDLSEGKADPTEISGNYIFLFHRISAKSLMFSIDPACVKCVYTDPQRKLLTTDFLALIRNNPGRYTLNRLALAENLITGSLITPDTYANEISRIDRANVDLLPVHFPGLTVRLFTPEIKTCKAGFSEAVDDANSRLERYFRSASAISNQFGANIGLTGGFDSRLLLMHALPTIDRIRLNSFWRPGSREYAYARKLAEASGKEFCTFEGRPFVAPEEAEMREEAFLFFDGQIRSQNRWDEEFNHPGYNKQLASGYFVGFHGCGGEQYRNADRYSGKKDVDAFLKYEWIFRQGETGFKDRILRESLFDNIKFKVKRLLQHEGSGISLMEMKRFQNEIWITANRATRLNVLNQQQFYFAPFTEYYVSHAAYSYVPYLGTSKAFQCEMMRRVSPHLSAVPNIYGINIASGESYIARMNSWLISRIPRPLLYKAYFLIKAQKIKTTREEDRTAIMSPLLQEIGIDYVRLCSNPVLKPLLASFDHLLSRTDLKT